MALLWAGKYALKQNEPQKARELWTQALSRENRLGDVANEQVWTDCHLLLGRMQLSLGNAAAAKDSALKANQLLPEDYRPLRLLYDASFRTGDLAETIRMIQQTFEKWPKNLDIALLYFSVLADTGNWQELSKQIEAQPPEWQRHLHLFRARIADLNGNSMDTLCHLIVGYWNGDLDRAVCHECYRRLDPFVRVDPESVSKPMRVLAEGFFAVSQPHPGSMILPDVQAQEPASDIHRFVLDTMSAMLLAQRGEVEPAEKLLQSLLERDPRFLPAMVILGTVYQAKGKDEQAEELIKLARTESKTNWKVWELDRMGAHFAVAEEGVRVTHVEPNGPWYKFGLRAGDVILQLDKEVLRDLPPLKRLNVVRLFQGGDVTYSSNGKTQQREMELVLF